MRDDTRDITLRLPHRMCSATLRERVTDISNLIKCNPKLAACKRTCNSDPIKQCTQIKAIVMRSRHKVATTSDQKRCRFSGRPASDCSAGRFSGSCDVATSNKQGKSVAPGGTSMLGNPNRGVMTPNRGVMTFDAAQYPVPGMTRSKSRRRGKGPVVKLSDSLTLNEHEFNAAEVDPTLRPVVASLDSGSHRHQYIKWPQRVQFPSGGPGLHSPNFL